MTYNCLKIVHVDEHLHLHLAENSAVYLASSKYFKPSELNNSESIPLLGHLKLQCLYVNVALNNFLRHVSNSKIRVIATCKVSVY